MGHVPVSLVAAGINCTESICVSADRVTVAIEYFLLGATKGFVQDLVAADMSQLVQVLVASGVMASSLDDLDQISTQLLQCSIASGGSETLLILEAMKMENKIKAPLDGTIKDIRVGQGTSVNAGDILVVLVS